MDSTVESKLNNLKGKHGTWTAVAEAIGVSKQYLFYCMEQGAAPPKLLEALGLEIKLVRRNGK